MLVLVTGGTGVVGTATVDALLARGHRVRLLSRHATSDASRWPEGVEAYEADVGDAAALRGAAAGCDVVVHAAGIVREAPPEATFEIVNVEGTRRLVEEAGRAGVKRFVFVSSLGAERGSSDYHRSKLLAEEHVRRFGGGWLVARVGNVFGPGDEVLSMLLHMVRTLPAVPVIDFGDQPFAPLWHGDIGQALALLAERSDLAQRTLELAGGESTSMDDVIERFGRITGRAPLRLPVPAALVDLGARLAQAVGLDLPITDDHVRMLVEHNVVTAPEGNALQTVLGLRPTPLADGLRRLADALPEQMLSDGVGTPLRKRFWTTIREPDFPARELMRRFRERFADVAPVETAVEPGGSAVLREGASITMRLPLRGSFQVRCEEITDRRITLATLSGHPLAGLVRFHFAPAPSGVHFEVELAASAATWLDVLGLAAGGSEAQDAGWRRVVERVAALAGGSIQDGIHSEQTELSQDEVDALEAELEAMVRARRQRDAAA